jgi:hypothetical protein
MQDFLFQYHGVSPTTWAYLSSLLMIGLFFKFGRFWSVRNLDLAMLIFLAPGLLLIHYGTFGQVRPAAGGGEDQDVASENKPPSGALADATTTPANPARSAGGELSPVPPEAASAATGVMDAAGEEPLSPAELVRAKARRWELIGYYWLFAVGGLWLIRLLLDPAMIRRPLLTPNLSVGGLTFIGVFLFMFLMANVVARPGPSKKLDQPSTGDSTTVDATVPNSARNPSSSGAVAATASSARDYSARMDSVLVDQEGKGPGYAVLHALPTGARKTVAILSHLAVVIGLVMVGYRHFDNMTNGIGAAVIYLMLPYTSQLTGRVDHVLPAALLIWAVLCYRRPLLAGAFMGAACGCVYYPLFALPVWLSFYWARGSIRFISSVVVVLVLMALSLLLLPDSQALLPNLQRMFGFKIPDMVNLQGVWNVTIGGVDPQFRISVLAAFVVLSFGLALWPARKNLGTVICYTASVMVAAQFWHGYGGGLYMAWYLPLVLLTIFRPNLEDRVAQAVIVDGWFSRATQHPSTRSMAA